MIFKTLDGYEYKCKFHTVDKSIESRPHQNARKLLQEKYPTVLILEEFQIQVKKNKYLYLDFFIPIYKIAIEVQGQQHEKYTPFFHNNQYNYIQYKINDKLKKDWAELNNIELQYLSEKELKC